MTEKKLKEFLKSYVEILHDFELPTSDFPLNFRTLMPAGCCKIYTVDGRHVATITVKEGGQTPSMPVCAADLAYTKMFVELANAYMLFREDVE